MGKEAKTNAMRILEREKVAYTAHEYPHEEGVAVDGVTVAASIGEDPACVYKTLVGQQQKLFCVRHSGGGRVGFKGRCPQRGRKERGNDPCGRYQQGHRLCAGRLQPGGHEKAVPHRL